MPGVRFFSGGRDGKQSVASEVMKLEIRKNGKMPSTDRFKFIMKKKLEEHKKTALMGAKDKRKMSSRAEKALKDIAAKKAAKEAKRIRRMVIVSPANFSNGRLTQKGKIYDIAGNMIGQVNTKNGKISTTLGTYVGKYKPKSYFVNSLIQDAIDKNSPYYINLRKMQQMQAAGLDPVTGQPLNRSDTINVHGPSNHMAAMHGGGYVPPSQRGDLGVYGQQARNEPAAATFDNSYGEAAGGPRQQVGVTAWGAMSDNVFGVFADNAWGGSMDNVWGGNSSDIWGGIGVNSYGVGGKQVQIWGTGNGVNLLRKFARKVAAFMGMHLRLGTGTAAKVQAARQFSSGQARGVGQTGPRSSSSGSRGPGARSSGPTTRGPSGPRSGGGGATRAAAPVGRR